MPSHEIKSRSAWPDSIMMPPGMRLRQRYQESGLTSVSVQMVPVPMVMGSASRPVTRSAKSSGGMGMRTSRRYWSIGANCGPKTAEMGPDEINSNSVRDRVLPEGFEGVVVAAMVGRTATSTTWAFIGTSGIIGTSTARATAVPPAPANCA